MPSSGHRRFDSVIFDVGGTLIGFTDWEPFQDFLADHGLPASEADGRALHARFLATLRSARDSAMGLGSDNASLNTWWRSMIGEIWPGRPDLAEHMFHAFRGDRFDRLIPDALPALEALQRLGMPLGVISNFTADLESLLRRLGVHRLFEYVIVSAQVGLAKPDPRIFDLAAKRSGFPRNRLLYVGDHIGDDVHGAQAAGLAAVLVDRRDLQPEAACPRIRSLMSLPAYIHLPSAPAPALLFDLDGVLIESLEAHLEAWQHTLGPLGISMQTTDLAPLEGMPTAAMARQLTRQLLGRELPEGEIAALAEIKRARFVETYRPRLLPGALPLLHNLHGRGYRLALVTGSAPEIAASILSATGLSSLFDTVITAADVTHGKPDPESYRLAAARLRLPPSQCLVIENAPLGIQAARAAGVGSIVALETTLPPSALPGADRTFPNVSALAAWLLAPPSAPDA